MFKGHQFVKLVNDSWILDLTEFTVYEVNVDVEGKVISMRKAFNIKITPDSTISFEREAGQVPLKVLKEAREQVIRHLDIMGLDSVE